MYGRNRCLLRLEGKRVNHFLTTLFTTLFFALLIALNSDIVYS